MFKFSSLFAAATLAASFDSEVARIAATGRVHHGFATMAETDGVLPLAPKGQPLNKADFLKLAHAFRAEKGAGYLKGHKQRAAWGAALDAIALPLQLGAAPGDDASEETRAAYAARVATLKASGAYFGDAEEWAKACAPVAKEKKAPTKGKGNPKGNPKGEGEGEGEGEGNETPTGPDVVSALNVVLAGLKTGAYTGEQVRGLAAAIVAAGFDVKAPEAATF